MDRHPVPVDQEFKTRLSAYCDGGDLPSVWTPERAVARIIDALRTLREGPSGWIGPAVSSTSWPPALRAAAEARDSWFRRNIPQQILQNLDEPISHSVDDDDDDGKPRARYAKELPTRLDLSMMEEALAWPLTYLGANALQADALSIYCLGKANRRFQVQPVLADRLKTATILAWSIAASREDAQARKLAAQGVVANCPGFENFPAGIRLVVLASVARRKIAREVAEWFNAQVAHFSQPDTILARRMEARDRFVQRCNEMGAAPEVVDPITAMPNVCLFRWQVDRHRRRAAEVIAAGLHRDQVAIR